MPAVSGAYIYRAAGNRQTARLTCRETAMPITAGEKNVSLVIQ